MSNNWAIVIGINDYLHHPERKLNYAVNDAQQMSKFLSDRAGFGTEQVIQCLGDESHRGSSTYPTCSNLLRVLEQDLKPDRQDKIDRLWFYFSGHGVSRNGRDYLITSDCLEDKIERFALPIDEVIAALQLHKEADIVLILDACRQVLGKKNFDNPIGEETIAAARERGITTIFSCDYGQYSYELEALQQGAFTYALIEGLAQHTLPHQLETYLRQRVPDLHLQHRRDRVIQTPRIRVEPAIKAFHSLLPNAATLVDIAVLVNRAKEAELEEDFETAKQLWWQIIEVAQSSGRIQEARTAIDRIDRKIAQRSGDRPTVANPCQLEPLQKSETPKALIVSVSNSKYLDLKRDFVLEDPEKSEESSTEYLLNTGSKVKLNTEVIARIENFETIAEYLSSDIEIKDLMKEAIRSTIREYLNQVMPERYYMRFDAPAIDERGNQIEAKSVEQELREAIAKALQDRFGAKIICVVLRTIDTPIVTRYKELLGRVGSLQFEVLPLSGGEPIKFYAEFRVLRVEENSWYIFQEGMESMQRLQEARRLEFERVEVLYSHLVSKHFEDEEGEISQMQERIRLIEEELSGINSIGRAIVSSVQQKLCFFPKSALVYRDLKSQAKLQNTINTWAREAVKKRYGLEIEIYNLYRDRTSME